MKTYRKAEAVRFFEEKLTFTCGPSEVEHLEKEEGGVNIIDVRRPEDYRKGHIPNAVNLPREQWESFVGLSKDKLNVVYCYTQQCHLATRACLLFARKGFRVKELEGGWKAWREYGLAVEEEPEVQRKAA
jgi:rhodanese-related sulfurtransferase